MSLSSPVRPGADASRTDRDTEVTAEIPVIPAVTSTAAASSGNAASTAGASSGGRASLVVAGAALSILAALLLGFVAELTLVGAVQHTRDQDVLYDRLRADLADAKVAVGQTRDGALIEPGTPVGQLRIPAIGVDQVVVEGTTSTQTKSGPGHVRDTVLPGQVGTSVLMGRQAAYGGPFARLGDLKVGDTIEVTTGQGVQTFAVTGSRHDGDTATIPVEAGKGRLSLVTADGPPYAPTGTLWVDAALTSPAQPTPNLVSRGVPGPEKPMSGDPAAWIPLVFWAQGLVLVALGVVWAAARWGRWQAWVVGVPALALFGLSVAGQVARLLPNLL